MRSRRRRSANANLPEINLVPMIDLMMTVLTFFIIVSMTLGTEELVDLELPAPQPEDQAPPPPTGQPFIIELDANGGVQLNNAPIDKEALKAQMQAYLSRREDNIVYLLPSQDLPYERVMQFLGEMREVGGDRVALAIEE